MSSPRTLQDYKAMLAEKSDMSGVRPIPKELTPIGQRLPYFLGVKPRLFRGLAAAPAASSATGDTCDCGGCRRGGVGFVLFEFLPRGRF